MTAMPIYEYRCDCGSSVEALVGLNAPAPACPSCGGELSKLVSPFAIGGLTDPGASQAQMPQTWKGTHGGDREYVTHLQRTWERRLNIEDRHPELAGDRRPIMAHEGPYHAVPVRAGDSEETRLNSELPGPGRRPDACAHHAHPHEHVHSDRQPP